MGESTTGYERVSTEKRGFWGAWRIVSVPTKEPSVIDFQVSKDGKISFSQVFSPSLKAQCEGRIDGKDYPVRGYNASMSFVRADNRILKYTWKEVGKPLESGTWTLSSDLRTMTEVEKGKDDNDTNTVYNREK
jgi:hypothetical protein